MEVAEYASSGNTSYQMRLLSFNESWGLQHKKVFEKDCFSPEFEKIGKEITLKCGGLPLAITVIAGFLSKIGKTLNEWQSVAEKVRSMVSTDVDVQCMRVLALSYHQLPHHLKTCFLYFAIFPEDEEIYVDKLVELLAAEGFLKVEETKSIEEVAEKCLQDLIDRSSLSIDYEIFFGETKYCRIHDVIREICLKEARNMNIENFIGENNGQNPSALSIHFSSNSRGRTSTQLNYRIIGKKLARSCPNNEARSIFFLNSKSGFMSELLPFRLVRVLDLALMNFIVFPSGLLDLIHLRYLALRLSPSVHYYLGKETPSSIDIPPSISRLCAAPLDPLRFLKMRGPSPTHAVPPLLLPPADAFPQNLKALTLCMTCLWWKDLSIVGKLPKLEVLKLIGDACKGKEWEAADHGFPRLKFLYLRDVDFQYWRAGCHHFPFLERLAILYCPYLDSIPQDFADITTLARISLTGCPESFGNSAKQIQQDMLDNYGNSSLVVNIVRHLLP
ncbi:putative late blight resistance protein homolog R1A-10 [Nicotiana tabacum]|uniref:Late blight resistance protein homolog R1A-10 n=1 Tax=Nicotiana tabacum TaxID=4097 RepID=A0AC58RW05_TOBAC